MNIIFETGHCGAAGKLARAALLFVVTTTANAGELGRLFFTPAQRAQLEYGQSQNTGSGEKSRTITVNGIVQKHGGARTAWINGVPQHDGGGGDLAPESLSITTPAQPEPVKVKVGQRALIGPAAPVK